MRILHLCQGYPPARGGSEALIAELSRRLVGTHGHEVCVSTSTAYTTRPFRERGDPQMAPGEDTDAGVRVRRHRPDPRLSRVLRRVQHRAYRHRVPGSGTLRTLYDGPVSAGMALDAIREPADVIGATSFPLLHMQYATWAGRSRGVPVALWGAAHPEDGWGFDRAPLRWAMRAADAYVCNTTYERDWAEARGARSERLHVISPGVDIDLVTTGGGSAMRERIGIPADSIVVGYVGQMGHHKGVDDLISAMSDVWRREPDTHLLLAGGSTDLVPRIGALVDALPGRLCRQVHTLFDFPLDDKAAILDSLDVFASPSGYESFGLTFCEAWANAVPVVGCRQGAVPAVVDDGENGILVGYKNPAELAGALSELIASRALRRRLGEAGRAKTRACFTWDRAADALDRLYRELAGGIA